MFIIGGLEDQLSVLVWSKVLQGFLNLSPDISIYPAYDTVFNVYISPLNSNQPITWLLVSVLLTIFRIYGYYLFLLFTVIANFYFTYKFFRFSKFRLIITLVYIFSSYFMVHFGRHLELTQLWLIPVVLIRIRDHEFTPKNALVTSVLLVISTLVSNYIGFFLLITVIAYLFLDVLFYHSKLRKNLYYLAVLSASFTLMTVLTLFKYIGLKYFSSDIGTNRIARVLTRPLEDFVTFSSRPWYYLTPSYKNPVLGFVGRAIVDSTAQTNHYLLDDYFHDEHAGNFLGYSLIVLFVLGIFRIRKRCLEKNKPTLIKISVIIFLLLLSMPPVFSVFGFSIYTPSYLIYKFVPMFRVTSRLSLLILFLILWCISEMFAETSGKWTRYVKILLIVTLLECYIPLKIVTYSASRPEYEFLHEKLEQHEKFVVYPFSKADDALFYLDVHRREQVNIRGYVTDDFDASLFTKRFEYEDPSDLMKLVNARYLIVYPDAADAVAGKSISMDTDLEEITRFSDSVIYRVY